MAWTSPRTYVAGELVTAAILNTDIRDNLLALSTWVSFTPTWTGSGSNPSIGNGTLTGKYVRAGQLVIFDITLVIGSTTTLGTGDYSWALPVTAAAGGSHVIPVSTLDSGNAYIPSEGRISTTTTLQVLQVPNGTLFGASSPMVWANGDTMRVTGIYIAA